MLISFDHCLCSAVHLQRLNSHGFCSKLVECCAASWYIDFIHFMFQWVLSRHRTVNYEAVFAVEGVSDEVSCDN